ncbi:hypothetical protein [Marinomonas aquiplantarum]|uniref:Uncharacterized protein n=1 Tax=Marinomonas aquiplantarum TaxID=491951 RepID=A0A366CXN6_9GAMM|nr:hypothetical protein [Marinomonas aquiplantarum]RBO82597.1 hypothetical protein DFP76_10561 [Marinomonas aquiplantarum]
MSKHKCSLGEVQESLSKLRVQLWATSGHLSHAGLSETHASRQLNATGEMLDQLLELLSRVPIPTEVFNNEGVGMATEVGHTSN